MLSANDMSDDVTVAVHRQSLLLEICEPPKHQSYVLRRCFRAGLALFLTSIWIVLLRRSTHSSASDLCSQRRLIFSFREYLGVQNITIDNKSPQIVLPRAFPNKWRPCNEQLDFHVKIQHLRMPAPFSPGIPNILARHLKLRQRGLVDDLFKLACELWDSHTR
ncbi:hypothetical protein B0H15DRAFT_562711 [Mycena belliarum]|uniref:Uncharacterized protein n=1 Tax=Mycena belliarum TaxID=1033014 RepID=A0AAD6XGJ7_9AGAR|nr:hypothetical protein B0H15DRAFT_562711 [Mycena belliae]